MKTNVDPACKEVFQKLKFSKHCRYIIFHLDHEVAKIEKVGQREEGWAEFLKALPPKEPRMCVFDLEYTTQDNMNCSRLVFCYWLPDGCPMKIKLLYATAKQNFKGHLDVIGKEINFNTYDEYNYESLVKEFAK